MSQPAKSLCFLRHRWSFILLPRISPWFGLNDKVLSWLKLSLLSCNFVIIIINPSVSDRFSLHQGIPHGSILGLLLFLLYTTLLSSLISDSLMMMIFNFLLPSLLLISLPTFYTYNMTLSPTACIQISSHSIMLKLSFSYISLPV